MMWYWGEWGWLAAALMMLFMVLFWGGIIALIAWLVIRTTRSASHGSTIPGEQSPLDIARERYAKGEISRDEFERIRKDLTGTQ